MPTLIAHAPPVASPLCVMQSPGRPHGACERAFRLLAFRYLKACRRLGGLHRCRRYPSL